MSTPLVVALGNRWRGDDAAGPLVIEALRQRSLPDIDFLDCPGDSMTLINAWQNREEVFLVDACSDEALEPGTVITIDNALENPDALVSLRHPTSSHVLDLGQALALSKAMNCAPLRLRVYAIAGGEFTTGSEPGAAVLTAASTVVERLVGMI